MARGAFCAAAADAICRRLDVATYRQYAAARSVRARARSTALGPGYRRRCGLARAACRRGRRRQLGHLPAHSLSGAIWRRRSALQQGHRLLSLLTARLYSHQELDAAHARFERAFRRNDLLGARRDRIRRAAPINVADSDRSRLSIARSFLRGEGLVLWSRPLSAALWRQRCSRRRKLHRYTCGATGSLAIDRVFDHCGVRRVGKPPGTYWLPAAAFILVAIGSFVLSGAAPVLFRHFFVKPSELQLEKPYIERNIALTRQAYNLDQIAAKPFAAEQKLSLEVLEANKATIENIRLWDWLPLSDTYAQLQEIRTYYKFHDVDVDRYWLDGSYQSVMLSARELRPSLLPPNAQTWVNRHVLFTHRNGAVMSPVTRKSTEGLPFFYLRDIPPVADGGPKIHEPRIYYGEESDSYVIVKGSTPEFDYPKGKDNVYAAYDGAGGVPIGAMVWRMLFAYYFNDPNLLLSNYITTDSRIMIRRNIQERVRTIAPFLGLDHDPYLVISNGRMFWMQDAYTTSSYFPSAQPAQDFDLNYIRNSVKVIVDAYDGTVDFYLMDPGDPIAATYQRFFPSLFKPFTAMPPDLLKHIRYPEDLFLIQARLYQTYHMEAADVFYNREDLWQFPRQPGGDGISMMTPYYIIMRLPGEPRAEFFLMLPMVPSRRDNMIAWLAARCDAPDYGKLIVYEFPKEKLVYGPFQIEARINQSTEISQQITLWNQMGSRVIRGANLLVIPIENSILYVTPLYLRAEHGHLPELKRVIAAYGEHVVMKETLAEALSALFMEPGAAPAVSTTTEERPATGPAASQAREALDRYNQAVERLRSGDWKGFGTQFDAMRELLEEMNRHSTGH